MRSHYAGSDAQARRIDPLRMLPVDASRQHRQPGLGQVHPAVPAHRPDEAPALHAPGEQAQAVRVGPEDFHPVAVPAPEDKKVAAGRVSTQRVLHFFRHPGVH